MGFLPKVGNFLLDVLKYASPLFLVIFTVIIVAGIMKWGFKIQEALYIVMKSPVAVVIWILAFTIGMILLIKYVYPLFN